MVSDEVWDQICEIDRQCYEVAFEGGSMDELREMMDEFVGPEVMAEEMRKRLPYHAYDNFALALTVVDIIRDRFYHDHDYKERLFGGLKDALDEYKKKNEDNGTKS